MIVIKEEYKEILDALKETMLADAIDFNQNDIPDLMSELKSKYTKRKLSYDNGASKFVLFLQGLPFVVKISFTSDEWGDELAESNYCGIEERVYTAAKEEGMQDFFAGIECIGVVGQHDIYVQELAIVLRASEIPVTVPMNSVGQAVTLMRKNSCSISSDWGGTVIDFFGAKRFIDFLTFVKRQEIDDLHDGNVGYIGSRPVLLDYSGYFG